MRGSASLEERRREQSLLPLSHADTARKPLSASRAAGAHQVPNAPARWPRTAQPPEDGNVCCLSRPACGIVSERPQHTKTATASEFREPWQAQGR